MRAKAHGRIRQTPDRAPALRVTSDLTPDTPICEAELAAIEAYLWHDLPALLCDDAQDAKDHADRGAKPAALCHNGAAAAQPRPRRKTA